MANPSHTTQRITKLSVEQKSKEQMIFEGGEGLILLTCGFLKLVETLRRYSHKSIMYNMILKNETHKMPIDAWIFKQMKNT